MSLFCVTVFIIIAGYNSFGWYNRHGEGKKFSKGLLFNSFKTLVPGYVIVTALYCFELVLTFDNNSLFDGIVNYFKHFIYGIIFFTDPGPMYYILVFCQLLIIRQPLAFLITKFKNSNIKIMLLLVISLVISEIFTTFFNIGFAYGGGRMPFGGTYLFLFTLGMVFSLKSDIFTSKAVRTVGGGLVLIYSGLAIAKFIIPSNFNVNPGLSLQTIMFLPNPPGVLVMFYSIGVFLLFKGWQTRVKIIEYLGKNSLPIFLYHTIFLFPLSCFGVNLHIYNTVISECFHLLLSVALSLFIVFLSVCYRKFKGLVLQRLKPHSIFDK